MTKISFHYNNISKNIHSFRRHIKCWYLLKFPERWSIENTCLIALDEIIDSKTDRRNRYVFRFRNMYEDLPDLRKRETTLNGELDRLEAIREELGLIIYGESSGVGGS